MGSRVEIESGVDARHDFLRSAVREIGVKKRSLMMKRKESHLVVRIRPPFLPSLVMARP